VLFRGITLPPDPISIVTDFCDGGSLYAYLFTASEDGSVRRVELSWKLRVIQDVAKGMLHLHRGIQGKQVIHRDLAARNILLKNGRGIITDFGLARMKVSLNTAQKTKQNVGPLKWMSPEAFLEKEYSTKSDVFSFAVVMYEVITQRPPWEGLTMVQASHQVAAGNRMTIPNDCNCPPSLKELIERCWAQEAATRPEFNEICDILSSIIQSLQ